jgi:hypothetical protein
MERWVSWWGRSSGRIVRNGYFWMPFNMHRYLSSMWLTSNVGEECRIEMFRKKLKAWLVPSLKKHRNIWFVFSFFHQLHLHPPCFQLTSCITSLSQKIKWLISSHTILCNLQPNTIHSASCQPQNVCFETWGGRSTYWYTAFVIVNRQFPFF